MDDLIKRQDAIDSIVTWTVEDRPDVEMQTDLVGRVNALPSVDSNLMQDRCKIDASSDLIRRQDAIDACLNGICANVHDCVDEIRKLSPTQQWTPCSERLPFSEYGESESVICCLDDGTQEILYFNGSNWCYPTGESYPFQEYKTHAVAWMPLPEPWKGE